MNLAMNSVIIGWMFFSGGLLMLTPQADAQIETTTRERLVTLEAEVVNHTALAAHPEMATRMNELTVTVARMDGVSQSNNRILIALVIGVFLSLVQSLRLELKSRGAGK